MEPLSVTLPALFAALWSYANSNLVIAFVGGFAGATGGALGAQRIVERTRKREDLTRELRYSNAAIMVAFSVCNAALALKKQHVKPMRDAFENSKATLATFKAQRDAGKLPPGAEFHLPMDLRTYPAPVVPIESLKQIAYQELSIIGRPLALVAVLEQSLIGLTNAIAKRDHMIQQFASGEIPEDAHAGYYLGLRQAAGHVNQEYPDLIEAIYSYVDDIAFFSSQLCGDLMKHGSRVREALLKLSAKNAARVSDVDFTGPKTSGLLPPDENYKDWLNAFVEAEER